MTPPRPPRSSSLDDASPEAAKASLERHRALWSDATVVGVGATARSVRELHILAHGLVRLLVVELGFRAVVIEGDRPASEQLDTFVREGTGDPRSILARSRPFLNQLLKLTKRTVA